VIRPKIRCKDLGVAFILLSAYASAYVSDEGWVSGYRLKMLKALLGLIWFN